MVQLIKSGILITAFETYEADILIDGEKIARVGKNLPVPGDAEVIDGRGKLIMPGGVDAHTHLDLPMFGTVSSDDHYTGMKAAAFGGTTTVIDFVPQDGNSLHGSVDTWHAKADSKAAVDFSFHMNITRLTPAIEAEMPTLAAEGITSFKVFMAYNNRLRLGDGEIFRVLRIAQEHGLLTMLHAENGDVIDILIGEALAEGHTTAEWHGRTRPAWGTVEAALRGGALAAQAGASLYLVHMNTAGEVDQLEYLRQHGVAMMGETCPQYLFFTEEELRRSDGAKWVCSPPLRTQVDNERLWNGLARGLIQTIATDHCPFFFEGRKPILYEGKEVAIRGKDLGEGLDFTHIPNGLPGVGDRLPILWTHGVGRGRITPNQFVALNCTNPAKLFGMYPCKGALLPGSDADIVIWDAQRQLTYGKQTAQHRTDYNLFEGWKLLGFPDKVFLRGNLIVDDGRWLGHPGMGRFIPRKPFAPVL
jgi:dihydropyrimidinase